MNGLASANGVGSAALRVALLAAMLMLAAGASQAALDGGRGSGRGGRTQSDGNGRAYSDRGGRAYNGGGGRTYDRGGRPYRGGGGRGYVVRGSRPYYGGGYYGGGSYYGGGYYGGARYIRPYSYRTIRPRTFVSFGIGLGAPYYCPPAYRSQVEPYPVEVESRSSIDVTNEPPAGCYYYDPSCERQFSNLDEYTDHLESQGHARTIEIVREESGDGLRTLEFVDGYWIVRE